MRPETLKKLIALQIVIVLALLLAVLIAFMVTDFQKKQQIVKYDDKFIATEPSTQIPGFNQTEDFVNNSSSSSSSINSTSNTIDVLTGKIEFHFDEDLYEVETRRPVAQEQDIVEIKRPVAQEQDFVDREVSCPTEIPPLENLRCEESYIIESNNNLRCGYNYVFSEPEYVNSILTHHCIPLTTCACNSRSGGTWDCTGQVTYNADTDNKATADNYQQDRRSRIGLRSSSSSTSSSRPLAGQSCHPDTNMIVVSTGIGSLNSAVEKARAELNREKELILTISHPETTTDEPTGSPAAVSRLEEEPVVVRERTVTPTHWLVHDDIFDDEPTHDPSSNNLSRLPTFQPTVVSPSVNPTNGPSRFMSAVPTASLSALPSSSSPTICKGDTTGTFMIRNRPGKEGIFVSKRCSWIANNLIRCGYKVKQGGRGRNECQETCGVCSIPTSTPSSLPSTFPSSSVYPSSTSSDIPTKSPAPSQVPSVVPSRRSFFPSTSPTDGPSTDYPTVSRSSSQPSDRSSILYFDPTSIDSHNSLNGESRHSVCPKDYISGKVCTESDEGLHCEYNFMYIGCTFDTLECVPSTVCGCSERGWSCKGTFIKPCSTADSSDLGIPISSGIPVSRVQVSRDVCDPNKTIPTKSPQDADAVITGTDSPTSNPTATLLPTKTHYPTSTQYPTSTLLPTTWTSTIICPSTYEQDATCTTAINNQVCHYDYVYTGCSWMYIRCAPTIQCTCESQLKNDRDDSGSGSGTWSCIEAPYRQCGLRRPASLPPLGEVCDPNVQLHSDSGGITGRQTYSPSKPPSPIPSASQTYFLTLPPTSVPTDTPSHFPSTKPSTSPSVAPLESPSVAPSIAPPTLLLCYDVPDFQFDNNATKTCGWVAKDLSRCKLFVDRSLLKLITDFCRKTCVSECQTTSTIVPKSTQTEPPPSIAPPSKVCPLTYQFGKCDGYEENLLCEYNHIYHGCSADTLTCLPSLVCECQMGGWNCKGSFISPCGSDNGIDSSDGLPWGETCDPAGDITGEEIITVSSSPTYFPSSDSAMIPSWDPTFYPTVYPTTKPTPPRDIISDGCPSTFSLGSCSGGYIDGLECHYNYFYLGCTWEELTCAPSVSCRCNHEHGSWECNSTFVNCSIDASAETLAALSSDLPWGKTCDPEKPLPLPPSSDKISLEHTYNDES